MSETVLSIDDGGVCVITLNRPARLNPAAVAGGTGPAREVADPELTQR